MNIYYVYAYLNSKTGLPYYIGKGSGDRAYQYHGSINLPPNKINIVFLEKNLTEIGALALERRYIKWYGRKIDKSGILLNILDGGQGACLLGEMNGMYGKSHSESAKKKMSDNHWTKRKEYTQEHRNKISDAVSGKNHPLFGVPRSDELKQKQSLAMSGRKLSEERKQQISQNQKGRKQSEETKAKIRAARLKYEEKRRLGLVNNKS